MATVENMLFVFFICNFDPVGAGAL